MIKDIAFTVYAVTDMRKARDFYEGTLGLVTDRKYDDIGESNFGWVEYLVNGNAFAIGCSPDWKPSIDGAAVAFEVADFDDYIKKLKDKGVKFKMDPMSFTNCSMAVIEDPDSNKIVIHRLHVTEKNELKKVKKIKVKKAKTSKSTSKPKKKKSKR